MLTHTQVEASSGGSPPPPARLGPRCTAALPGSQDIPLPPAVTIAGRALQRGQQLLQAALGLLLQLGEEHPEKSETGCFSCFDRTSTALLGGGNAQVSQYDPRGPGLGHGVDPVHVGFVHEDLRGAFEPTTAHLEAPGVNWSQLGSCAT